MGSTEPFIQVPPARRCQRQYQPTESGLQEWEGECEHEVGRRNARLDSDRLGEPEQGPGHLCLGGGGGVFSGKLTRGHGCRSVKKDHVGHADPCLCIQLMDNEECKWSPAVETGLSSAPERGPFMVPEMGTLGRMRSAEPRLLEGQVQLPPCPFSGTSAPCVDRTLPGPCWLLGQRLGAHYECLRRLTTISSSEYSTSECLRHFPNCVLWDVTSRKNPKHM